MDKSELDKEFMVLYKDLKGFSYYLTKDTEESEDLLNDTYIKVFSNIDKYKCNYSFKNWVYSIMHNMFIDNKRKLINKYTHVPIFDSDSCTKECSSSKLMFEEVNNFIRKKFKDKGNCIILFSKGYSIKELANRYTITEEAVKSRIKRVRDTLNKKYK